ncbi:LysR family transcriptional regulator [Chordicoccus furentiruminis]|jgi:DNA-binding transcriptional LysR family regulator|uniref:LysR family transcriptional regulator n=1 Tax=Chordicoccus furentiruminis TaxID=2709410 RepID=UPI0023A7D82E|nr:LysR family transcriptional regulator [Chordicoccus furentiruminis]
MTLQQIHYALTIAETGSMSKAAEKLFISQPTLTGAIRDLEADLGITIFLRSSRGMAVTNEGAEFLSYAAQMQQISDLIDEKYRGDGGVRYRFHVSAQHYSFAVKAFVETVRGLDPRGYDLAIRETRTREVIRDVGLLRSEIGVLYLSSFNRKILEKAFSEQSLVFHHLIDCDVYAYLAKTHPCARKAYVSLADLLPYPCLAFEQGDDSSIYYAEEMFPDYPYPHLIHANDRATMLNLMVGLNGFTLCSGLICEELNGGDYVAVPFRDESCTPAPMEIGYLTKRQSRMSGIGQDYIRHLTDYLHAARP